jgi:hypothetical protein
MTAEPRSLIAVVIERGIRENPGQAAVQMLQLMRDNARLEAELFCLRSNLKDLARAVNR